MSGGGHPEGDSVHRVEVGGAPHQPREEGRATSDSVMSERSPALLPLPVRPGAPGPVRRVLMTTPSEGAVWEASLGLSRALGSRGVEVTLACLGAPLPMARWAEAGQVPGLRVEQSTWRLEGPGDVWEDVKASGEWLLELEARLRPDAIHLNGYCHGALPWKRRPLVVGHECALARWEAVRGEPALERDVRYRWEVTRGLRAAGHVVAPSSSLLAALMRHHGPLPSASVIFPGRHPFDFPPAAAREPFVLATGALWDEAANLEVLEAVAPCLDWPVLVAGELEHPDGGEVRARYLRSLGPQAPRALAGLMGRASVFVLPARHEPSGSRVLEAALAGCALVLGDIPSLREQWEDAAVFVPPEDTDMLARALRRLVTEPVLCARMSTLARTRALEFTPERQADAYVRVYDYLERVAGGASPPQPQRARAT